MHLTGDQITALVGAAVALIGAAAAWLKSHAAQQQAGRAETKANKALNGTGPVASSDSATPHP